MSHVKQASKTRSSRTHPVIDPCLVIARLCHLQRLQREGALRARAAPLPVYIPRMDLCDDVALPNISAMLELPGIDRHTLSLQIVGAKLVVHGGRLSPLAARLQVAAPAAVGEQAPSVAAHSLKVRELKFGSFHREIDVPLGIETTQITAELTDGMLFITWPRVLTFPITAVDGP